MKRALITGITGQDGSLLAEFLLAKGYSVVGTSRKADSTKMNFPGLSTKIDLVSWDLLDKRRIIDILQQYQPAEIFNLAAYSSGSAMFDDPLAIGEVNGLAVTRIMEAIRAVDVNIRFCQASSSEMFGKLSDSPQSEKSVFHPRSPYGAAKLYAHTMIGIYRQHYGLFACSAILFNHESPRRGMGFVTRKITHGAAKIKLGLANELCLGNLDACRDWGFAGDYMYAMWLMLQQEHADDYVIATGETHSVRDICEIAFGRLDLDYRDYVREAMTERRPTESLKLVGTSEKARNQLNWVPVMGFRELIINMVDADMQLLSEKTHV